MTETSGLDYELVTGLLWDARNALAVHGFPNAADLMNELLTDIVSRRQADRRDREQFGIAMRLGLGPILPVVPTAEREPDDGA